MSDQATQETIAAMAPETREAMEAVFGSTPAAAAEDANGAPPGATEPAAATPAAEPAKPDPQAERIAARIAAARRADLRAAESRRAMDAERAEIEKQRAELKELAAIAEQAKAAKLSPSKLIELAGLDPKAFLETLATEHEPATVAARVASATKTETEQLKAEIEALRKEREAEKLAEQRSKVNAEVADAQKGFIDHVATNAEKYPHLVDEFTPEEIAIRGLQLADEHAAAYHAKFGVYPDDDVIAEFMESEAKQRAERRTAWRGQIGKAAPVPSKGGLTGERQQAQPDSSGRSPRTLTSSTTSTRAAAPKPWSQESADEESIRILKGATR